MKKIRSLIFACELAMLCISDIL